MMNQYFGLYFLSTSDLVLKLVLMAWVAVDWGTSSFRCWLVENFSGCVLDSISDSEGGIMQVGSNGFEKYLHGHLSRWISNPSCPKFDTVLACGMIASALGWIEVPYVSAPTTPARVIGGSKAVRTSNYCIYFVPGVKYSASTDPVKALLDAPEVMRGEETQLFGSLKPIQTRNPSWKEAIVLLPGTHSKWTQLILPVNADVAPVVGPFRTYMTGEIFSILSKHSILGKTMKKGGTTTENTEAFNAGVRRGLASVKIEGAAPCLTNDLFRIRTLALNNSLKSTQLSSYLSGLLIGYEVASGLLCYKKIVANPLMTPLVVVGKSMLAELYISALEIATAGLSPRVPIISINGESASLDGLAIIHKSLQQRAVPLSVGNLISISVAVAGPLLLPCKKKMLTECPIIAILRGIKPEEAVYIYDALVGAGIRIIEVPLNSPEPYESIRRMVRRKREQGHNVIVGAGTVLTPEEVEQVRAVGGELIVSPNTDVATIRAAKAKGLYALPGFITPSEAFAGLGAGADGVKLFPATAMSPQYLKDLNAVIGRGWKHPGHPLIIPVGGITPTNTKEWPMAHGFGIGSALYKPGDTAAIVSKKAHAFLNAFAASRKSKI